MPSAVENQYVTHGPGDVAADGADQVIARFADRQRALLRQLHFDELVISKRLLNLSGQPYGDAALSNLNHRCERVRQSAQIPPLFAG